MSDQNRNSGSQRQQPQQGNTGAGSRQMEAQTGGGSYRQDGSSQQDQGRPPTSKHMEQMGGVGHQQEQGRGEPGEMPEQAGGRMGQQAGGARQQGDMSFDTDWDEELGWQADQGARQQQAGAPQGDDPNLRSEQSGRQQEQQSSQQGATRMGADTRGGSGRQSRKNGERDRGDPENR